MSPPEQPGRWVGIPKQKPTARLAVRLVPQTNNDICRFGRVRLQINRRVVIAPVSKVHDAGRLRDRPCSINRFQDAQAVVVKEEGVFPEQAIELGHDGVSHISAVTGSLSWLLIRTSSYSTPRGLPAPSSTIARRRLRRLISSTIV